MLVQIYPNHICILTITAFNMSARGLEAVTRLLQQDKDFFREIEEYGGRAPLLYGFNLDSNEKKRIVNAVKQGWNPKRSELPSRITKGTGGIRAFF